MMYNLVVDKAKVQADFGSLYELKNKIRQLYMKIKQELKGQKFLNRYLDKAILETYGQYLGVSVAPYRFKCSELQAKIYNRRAIITEGYLVSISADLSAGLAVIGLDFM